ncbi:MAG: tRNA (adenosine(37)-N6)-dimethylallyltransferase MiaA [Alphaproteobacteria bacterium]
MSRWVGDGIDGLELAAGAPLTPDPWIAVEQFRVGCVPVPAEAERIPVVVVAGPTASGKSALALDIALAMDGTVINADSMQVYRDLAVLTARPSAADAARAPHRLFGTLDGAEACSVGRWRAMAEAEVRDAHAAGRLPIVVGGTGLYLSALMRGLAAIPDVPGEIVAGWQAELARVGAAGLYARLAACDPEMAARLRPSDRQRVVRALAVRDATGRSLADWQAQAPAPPPGLAFHVVLLMPPRAALYAACDARFAAMVEAGAVDEVRALRARGLPADRPVMKAIGVAELGGVLDGSRSLDDAIAASAQATRNYAKRQCTWFRHQIIADQIIDAQFSERETAGIFSKIRHFRLTAPE